MALSVDPALALAVRIGLALLFANSARQKLRDVAAFRAALGGYRLVPEWAQFAATFGLIAAELATSGALVLSALGGVPAASLLALYTVAIGVNLARGRREIDCGCFGPASRQPLSSGLVVRNVGLIALALASALPAASRSLTWLDLFTIAAVTGLGTLLQGSVGTLLANAPRLRALRDS